MTASALNTASIAPTAAAGQAGASAAVPGAAATGFDALLATLFAQVDGTAAPAAGAPSAGIQGMVAAETTEPAGDVLVAADDDKPADAGVPADADTVVTPGASAALAAAIAAQQAASATPAPTAKTEQTPHAWGRDKAKGAPAQPAILHANPNAETVDWKVDSGQ